LRIGDAKGETLETRRQSVREADRLRDLRLPPDLVPQLELAALADEDDALVEARVAAKRGRHEDAACRVDLDFVGVADDQPLKRANLVVERRQAHELRLDRLPVGKRVDQQAAAVVGGDDGAAVVTDEVLTMTRGNGEAPLGIEYEFRDAAKDGPARRSRARCRARHVAVAAYHGPTLRPAK